MIARVSRFDRAAPSSRSGKYVSQTFEHAERVSRAVRPGGHVIIGTFAPDGPERCSGLPVVRHDAATLGELLGHSFELIESRRHDHQTPTGATQRFQFSRFRRI